MSASKAEGYKNKVSFQIPSPRPSRDHLDNIKKKKKKSNAKIFSVFMLIKYLYLLVL